VGSVTTGGLLLAADRGSDNSLRRYGHSKFSKMAAGRHLGFDRNESGANRSADQENCTLEPNMKYTVD